MNEIFYFNGEFWDHMIDMSYDLYFRGTYEFDYYGDDIMGMYLMGGEL
jgi:hypothetical protein